MNRFIALIVFLVLWTVAAFVAGWQVRDGSADTAGAKHEAATQTARAEVAEQARATDHTNAQASAAVETKRVADASKLESNFRDIDEGIRTYAQQQASKPHDPRRDCPRGSADDEFMRLWNAANEGRSTEPQPGHRPSADAGSEGRRADDQDSGRRDATRQSQGDGADGARTGAAGERTGLFDHVADGIHDQWRTPEPSGLVRTTRTQPAVRGREQPCSVCGQPVHMAVHKPVDKTLGPP